MLRKLVAISCLLCVARVAHAGTWTPNNFLYEPNLRVYNTVEENLFITGMVRVDKRLGYEIWVGDPDYGSTLQGALTAIGGNQAALRIPAGTWRIGANLTIPANVTLKPERGAKLTIATGSTLTINGPLEAGLNQIFSCTGTGKVVMKAEAVKVPEWWGATGDGATDDTAALQAWATCGGNLNLPQKTYKITAGIIVPQYAILDGQGTINQAINTVEGLIVKDDVVIKNISLTGSMVAYGPHFLHVGIICYSFRGGSGNDLLRVPNFDLRGETGGGGKRQVYRLGYVRNAGSGLHSQVLQGYQQLAGGILFCLCGKSDSTQRDRWGG